MENTIKVKCHTNLDDFDCSIVTEMYCRPLLGDRVKVTYFGRFSSLEIVSIQHVNPTLESPAYLFIELHHCK